MNIDVLLQPLKEIILFNSFESFLYLSMFLLLIPIFNKMLDLLKISNKEVNNIKLNKKQFVFHIFMLSVLNYILSTYFNIGILIQIINILGIAFYLSFVLKINVFNSIIMIFIAFIFLFVLEMSLGIIYQYLFHINFLSMNNDFRKFLNLAPIRSLEILLIYILYKLEKRGEIVYEKNI